MSSQDKNEDGQQPSPAIFVEFVKKGEDSPELEQVSSPLDWFRSKTKPELEKKSVDAVDKAMTVIREMSERVSSTIKIMENQPTNVEVEFGIKFDAEFDVMVAKVGAEASMTVNLKWERERK